MDLETKTAGKDQGVHQPEIIYTNLSGEQEATIIESLCISCEKQGKTAILLAKIPFFKDVIISSFICDECGYRNSEIQTGTIQDKGVKIKTRMTNKRDLNRDIVLSEHSIVKIPEYEVEYSSSSQKATISTVEGLLQKFIDDCEQEAKKREEADPSAAERIKSVVDKLQKAKESGGFPFTLIIDDPSGNSYIKNPYAPSSDPEMKIERYHATKEQLEAMGFNPSNAATYEELKNNAESQEQAHKVLDFTESLDQNADLKNEALGFPATCYACFQEGESKMCTISIPYFKELIVMSFNCNNCGIKSREVKVGGAISEKAKKITLRVEKAQDLERDVFKSDSSLLIIPELDLELLSSTLGGVFTTVEGLLKEIQTSLEENNPFSGDSCDTIMKKQMRKTLDKLADYASFKNEEKFTLIIDDPLSNCFILNPFYPKEDPQITVEVYERTHAQNEELGLNDLKTENY